MGFQTVRFTNIVLLVSVLVLTLSGVYGLFWTLNGWLFDVHRFAGWVLVAAIPWKMAISMRSLRRGLQPNFDRGVVVVLSLVLAVLTLVVIALGLAWGWRLGPQDYWLRQTAISWHWMLALGLLAPFLVHAWRRWPRPRKVDFASRRAALKMLGLGVAGLAGWWIAESLAGWRERADAPRRFTGSRLDGLFSGNRFPVTHTRAAAHSQTDPVHWRLELSGAVAKPNTYTYQDVLGMPAVEKVATLDCTLGWYTTQTWRGVPLRDLLEQAKAMQRAFGVRLESVTGYAHVLAMAEAEQVLLATHVEGELLAFEHGFPVRAVVPSRRGWFWVKWLSRIEVLSLPHSEA